MTYQRSLNLPRGAEWLVSLFANREDSIAGDLSEEFTQLASQSGRTFAGRWYWRQALKSLPHLFLSAFRKSPWLSTGAVVAGFLLRRLIAHLPGAATFALVDKFGIYEHHFALYKFLASTALDIEHVLTFLLVGCFVALLARGREMPPAIVLSLIFAAMALLASVYFVVKGGDAAYLWRMSWYFGDSLAVILGAAFVRTTRSAGTRLSIES